MPTFFSNHRVLLCIATARAFFSVGYWSHSVAHAFVVGHQSVGNRPIVRARRRVSLHLTRDVPDEVSVQDDDDAAELRRALALDPTPEGYLACLATADELFECGEPAEAAECWQLCLALDPANAEVSVPYRMARAPVEMSYKDWRLKHHKQL